MICSFFVGPQPSWPSCGRRSAADAGSTRRGRNKEEERSLRLRPQVECKKEDAGLGPLGRKLDAGAASGVRWFVASAMEV